MTLKTGVWFLWFSCNGQQKISKMEVKIFLSAPGSIVNLHWIFNSSGQARIWPLNAHTQLLPHPGLVTQFQEYNFPMNHSSLFLTPHFQFYYFLGSWLFYSLSIISLFWGYQMFKQFQIHVVLALSSQSRVLFFHMVLWDPCAKTPWMAPKSQLHGWLLCTSLHACMAQEQLRQDPALNGGSWLTAESYTRALSASGEIFAPLAGVFNWEKNFSLKVPTALQCWKKSFMGEWSLLVLFKACSSE